MVARWHEDSDHWVWAIYESDADTDATKDAYIIPRDDGWWIIDAKEVMSTHKDTWIGKVTNGEGTRVSGPFKDAESAKAAWRLMYG
jgi:hypothetical protein